MELILASGSPRRKELLALITPEFTVHTSDVDESVISAPAPELLVQKLAQAKCRAVAAQHPAACVLGCDTVVDVDGEVLGKPHGAADARRMMRLLSGRRVLGGARQAGRGVRLHVLGAFRPFERGRNRGLHFHPGAL